MGRRVTITLDEDVAQRMDAEARRHGASIDDLVNETLRHVEPSLPKETTPFKAYARDLRARPGVNFDSAWKLLDDDRDSR